MKDEVMVGIYHLQNQMELLEFMIANLSCGNVTDDKEKERKGNGLTECGHFRQELLSIQS